jgi:hypothetical protein
MIKWDYRVVLDSNGLYTIREVFYYADGISVTPAVEPMASSLTGLQRDINAFMKATLKPVLRVGGDGEVEELFAPEDLTFAPRADSLEAS